MGIAGLNLDPSNEELGGELRSLAERMLQELDNGEIVRAVALVNEIQQLRDNALYIEIGKLTRALHEAIKNLHVDTNVGASSEIANATDKLAYVLELTDKSANRTMDLVDAGMPLANEIHEGAATLSKQWQRFLKKEIDLAEFRALSRHLNQFLASSTLQSHQLQGQLSEIVLAQDFQDLTGQVIHKVAALVRDVEARLVQLVVMAGQVDKITGIVHDLDSDQPKLGENIAAEGPQINKASVDVVASQDDVDDLLSSLGF